MVRFHSRLPFLNKEYNMTEFKPTRKNVLIAQVARKTTTDSGLIIEGARSVLDNETAKVVAIGPEVTMVNIGDELLVQWEKGSVITLNGEQRVVINEDYIVAVLER